ncbi:MAG: tetratricopeptide repeat protein, partial [Verrucomicrobiota bacterium]
AYRLAQFYYNRDQLTQALPHFETASEKAARRDVRLSATFNKARVQRMLNRTTKARESFEWLVEQRDDNPFLDVSLLFLARDDIKAGREEEALAGFAQLITAPAASRILAEALAKSGSIYSAKGDAAKANGLFRQVLEMDAADAVKWRADAHLALLTNHYQKNDYSGVLDLMQKYIVSHGNETEPKVLIMSGNAHLRLGQFPEAIRDYSRLEILYQDKPEAAEASYQKLVCLLKTNDQRFEAHLDQYISRMKTLDKKFDSAKALRRLILDSRKGSEPSAGPPPDSSDPEPTSESTQKSKKAQSETREQTPGSRPRPIPRAAFSPPKKKTFLQRLFGTENR